MTDCVLLYYHIAIISVKAIKIIFWKTNQHIYKYIKIGILMFMTIDRHGLFKTDAHV